MNGLTQKEEETMQMFWNKGPMFVRELLDIYDDPKPHFNTVSTVVRGLEEKGYLDHESFGKTYRYYPTMTAEEFHTRTLKRVIKKYFNNSYLNVVSTLVKDEDLSIDEVKQLIKEVEQKK
ncbi:MAG: BlaI/MecI/CopY family transcriptional regulator [Bacteroidaceae bacterium]